MHTVAPNENYAAQQEANRIRTNKRLVRELVCLLAVIYLALGIFEADAHDLNQKLLRAVSQNDVAETKHLLQKGADPNAITEPDYITFDGGHIRSHHIKVSALETGFRQSPNFPIVKALLEAGARIGPGSTTSASLCSPMAPGSLETVRLLLAHGASVNERDQDGQTPLFCFGADNLPVISYLIQLGADVNAKSHSGCTPLYNAVSGSQIPTMRLLVDAGTSVNVQDKEGDTPLHWANYNSTPSVVRFLLERGADANIRNKQGETALYGAISRVDRETVKILIANGANVNIKTNAGETPLARLKSLSYLPPADVKAVRRMLIAAGAK